MTPVVSQEFSNSHLNSHSDRIQVERVMVSDVGDVDEVVLRTTGALRQSGIG